MDLFLVSRADIFAIYPKILNELLEADNNKRNKDGHLIKDIIYLPSDAEFQERVYYRLLDVQKGINELIESGVPLTEITKKAKPVWDPDTLYFSMTPMSSPGSGFSFKRKKCVTDYVESFLDMNTLHNWSLEDLTKAGKLLRKPPVQCTFLDEHEMRRVYSMIYDVFRYKNVLNQALIDATFFTEYPELQSDKTRIWLLLFDLHLRHFLKRDPEERIKQKHLYKEAYLDEIQRSIWNRRVRLAAAVSRLRIKNNALHLSKLLPIHLQDEKVAIASANPIVTGWCNPFKISTKNESRDRLQSNGLIELEEVESGEVALKMHHFKWDKVCPLFISCIPPDRGIFAQSDLVKNQKFILQDRAFSLGPALFSRLLDYYEIEGDMVQTHVSSPRSTAYLAALFRSNNRINEFIAFGAGTRVNEYRDFLSKLECENVKIYAENFCSISLDSHILDKVVGIFVTPPNSYSGVCDPIDLICSRGGDLTMLEVLTESEMSDDGKKRVSQILEEQRESLRLSMSRPQVQFCLYETHSIVDAENQDMVKLAMDDINRSAHNKHIRLFKEKKRLEEQAEREGISMEQLEKLQGGAAKRKQREAEALLKKDRTDDESSSSSSGESENELLETSRSRLSKRSNASSDEYHHIKIPKTDLFEMVDLPDFCLYQDKCVNFKEQGCFLAIIKRKMITHLDEKYLILMAERRGLFGDTSPKKGRMRPPTKTIKKEEKPKPPKISKRRKSDDMNQLVERIAHPTHASVKRSHSKRKSSAEFKLLIYDPLDDECESCIRHESRYLRAHTPQPRAKKWWKHTSKYICRMMFDVPINEKSDRIYDAICNNTILPLKLPRRISPATDRYKSPDRLPYPLTTNFLEFQEYRRICLLPGYEKSTGHRRSSVAKHRNKPPIYE